MNLINQNSPCDANTQMGLPEESDKAKGMTLSHLLMVSASALMGMAMILATPAQAALVPLHSWYDANRGDAFTTTTPNWIGGQGQTRSPNYGFNRAEGYVFSPTAPQPPTTVPLYGWYSPSREDNFISSTWTGRPGDVRSPDYDFVRLEGYAYDRPLAGTLPLQGFWSSLLGDNRQTTTPVWERSNMPYLPFYEFVRTEGYVLPAINPSPYTPEHFGNGTTLVNGQRASGTRPLLVIMVRYADNGFHGPHTISYFQDMFFGADQDRTVSGHFYWNSGFAFLWSNAGVVNVAMPDDPTTSTNNESLLSFWNTPGANLAKHDAMVLQAAAAAGVNFASFDRDGDGAVSTPELGVMVINASPVGGDCGQSRGHQAVTLNGKSIELYMSHVDEGAGFATMCHELYHQFGMDHVYGNPSINYLYTPMAGTCTGMEDVHNHSNLDAYHKIRLGWFAPRIYSSSGVGASAKLNAPQYLEGTPTDNLPIILFDAERQTANGDEYFILEYRRPTPGTTNSYDAHFPGTGLVIWWVRTEPGQEDFRHFNKILPGTDGLQSIVAMGSDDQAVDLSIPPDGIPDVIRPGSDFELQSVARGNDQIADDSAMMHIGAPNRTWGSGRPWRSWDGQIRLTYYDGSDSGFRVRVGPTSNDDNTIAIEWNMDEVAPRLDRILSPLPACATPRSEVVLEGMFGASQRTRHVALQNGSEVYDLDVTQWTCHRVVAQIPNGVPAGDYMLTTYGSSGHSLEGNSLPFEVKQSFRLEPIADEGFLGVRGIGDDSTRSVLQYSIDLHHWKIIQTNEGPFQYLDPNVSKFKRKFYRVIELP